jgi:hypothetical protein
MSLLIAPDTRQPNTHFSPVQGARRLRQLVRWREEQEARSCLAHARVLGNHAQIRTTVAPAPSWLPTPTPNECYANTVAAVTRPQASGLTYVEGYAYLAEFDIAYEHAWLEDMLGNVIETTWPAPARGDFGMPLWLERLSDIVGVDDRASLLFGDRARRFAFLRGHADCCGLLWTHQFRD